jgi:AcrR family transcriptional regulator
VSKKATKTVSPREAITEVAVKLFSEHGYTATTMRDIAKAVGVLPGSLYAHIESKDALLLEIVTEGISRFLGVADTLKDQNASACDKLRAAIRWHVEAVAEDPERTLVVFHQWRYLEEPNRGTALAMRRRYADAFFRIVDEGKASGEFSPKLDTRVSVFGILGALNWVPEWYSAKGPMAASEIAERLADTLILGLDNSPSWQSGRVAAPAAPVLKMKAAPQGRGTGARARTRT